MYPVEPDTDASALYEGSPPHNLLQTLSFALYYQMRYGRIHFLNDDVILDACHMDDEHGTR
jgi:hypothetical protein